MGCSALTYIALILTLFARGRVRMAESRAGSPGRLHLCGRTLSDAPLLGTEVVADGGSVVPRASGNLAERSIRQRSIGLGAAVLVLGLIIPWRITITGPFVAAPALSIPLTAPDSGFIERVQVLEGTHVTAGAPLLQIRNLELERELATHRRISDSLAVRSAQARGRSQTSELALLEAAGLAEQARVAGLRDRVAALRIRALGSGTVVTPRPGAACGSVGLQWRASSGTGPARYYRDQDSLYLEPGQHRSRLTHRFACCRTQRCALR